MRGPCQTFSGDAHALGGCWGWRGVRGEVFISSGRSCICAPRTVLIRCPRPAAPSAWTKRDDARAKGKTFPIPAAAFAIKYFCYFFLFLLSSSPLPESSIPISVAAVIHTRAGANCRTDGTQRTALEKRRRRNGWRPARWTLRWARWGRRAPECGLTATCDCRRARKFKPAA
jgi:hypothetical protein